MDYALFRRKLGNRIRTIRRNKGIKQERLAELVDKTTEHISYLERGERSPSFELLLDLSHVLEVSLSDLMDLRPDEEEPTDEIGDTIPTPIPAPVLNEIHEPIKPKARRREDTERLQEGLAGVQALQKLANDYGIKDVFQDNGGKVLQLLILLGLKQIPGREGNDAIDDQRNEYELKTINIAPRHRDPNDRNLMVSTHHHLNSIILSKYRKVKAWYFGIYNDIELAEIWEVHPSMLEALFSAWEKRVVEEGIELNNPKISLKLVRTGKLVYPEKPVLDMIFEPRARSRSKKALDIQSHLPGLE